MARKKRHPGGRPPYFKPDVTAQERAWESWRTRKAKTLLREGLPLQIALRIASADTRYRKTLEGVVGQRRARNARLTVEITETETVRFRMEVHNSHLTDDERAAESVALREAFGADFAAAA